MVIFTQMDAFNVFCKIFLSRIPFKINARYAHAKNCINLKWVEDSDAWNRHLLLNILNRR